MKKLYLALGGIAAVTVFVGSMYIMFFMKGDTTNRLERQAFISHGSNTFDVTILNGGGPVKVYHSETKVTLEAEKGYYFFWANVNGKRVYVQSPISSTLIEEK